ncbi:hypothetical protein AcV5_002445 [Taiwanofungus camphoratus]|nr:hypothetical protein AcV5_002445 [Antrodia cinnamomea]
MTSAADRAKAGRGAKRKLRDMRASLDGREDVDGVVHARREQRSAKRTQGREYAEDDDEDGMVEDARIGTPSGPGGAYTLRRE